MNRTYYYKAWYIVAIARDGGLYCRECAKMYVTDVDAFSYDDDLTSPVFIIDVTAEDCCDQCLTLIDDTL